MLSKLMTTAAVAAMISVTPAQAQSLGGGGSWDGFYAGLHAGYARGGADFAGVGLDQDPSGALGGGQLGYNWQFGSFVAGIEADFSFAGIDDDVLFGGKFNVGTEYDWIATVQARGGITATESVLLYGTAGIAFADASVNASIGGLAAASFSDTVTGWTAGAGVEFQLSDQISVDIGYSYIDFGSEDLGVTGLDIDLDLHTVKLGLNYAFN